MLQIKEVIMTTKGPRHRWSTLEERILLDIVDHGEGGALKRVIVENITNVKLTRHNAWERFT